MYCSVHELSEVCISGNEADQAGGGRLHGQLRWVEVSGNKARAGRKPGG